VFDVVVVVMSLLVAYLLGTFPSALLVGRRMGADPSRLGSGNPGTTNVLRTAGRRAAAITLVGDAGKGAIAASLGWLAGAVALGSDGRVSPHTLGVLCGLAAVVGHVAPATRRFVGGKGVATAFGVLMVVFPLLTAFCVVVFGVVLVLGRIASLASLAAAVAGPLAAAVVGVPGIELISLVACAGLVLVRHADNIRRLARGQEPRVGV
jgi:glycerol-3-phosphate acyltransferase PlsY